MSHLYMLVVMTYCELIKISFYFHLNPIHNLFMAKDQKGQPVQLKSYLIIFYFFLDIKLLLDIKIKLLCARVGKYSKYFSLHC